MSSIAENLKAIQVEIQKASGGRSVSIVGVTKHQTEERVSEAIAAGLTDLAVNYAQEGQVLRSALHVAKGRWHFIGHIQSRKVKYLPDYFCIQSIDRIEIAEDLNARLEKREQALYVLVEVNIGREAQKSGVLPERLPGFLEALVHFPNLKLNGFMAMPPAVQPVEARRPYFMEMAGIFERFKPEYALEVLSMGTSEDYLVAVQEGSTMVRLGTCLFGPRT